MLPIFSHFLPVSLIRNNHYSVLHSYIFRFFRIPYKQDHTISSRLKLTFSRIMPLRFILVLSISTIHMFFIAGSIPMYRWLTVHLSICSLLKTFALFVVFGEIKGSCKIHMYVCVHKFSFLWFKYLWIAVLCHGKCIYYFLFFSVVFPGLFSFCCYFICILCGFVVI